MYHYPGEYVTDFCITRHNGVYHLFHIRGERWTWPQGYKEIDLGHATSTDLRLWTPHDPVVPVGPEGAWDVAGVWAPDVIERDGVYYLSYTGSDSNYNQRIGLALSTDLYEWHKFEGNPVVEAGEWSDRARGKNVAGRDSMIFHDQARNRYLLYYTATMADGRACIALAESQDLLQWKDLGPTYIEEDRSYNRCESAYVVEHDGRYYLFYSAKGGPQSKGYSPQDFAHFDIVYLVSDDPTKGWTKPRNHELLKGWTCASEHPTFDGVTYMFYVIQEEIEGIWGASSLSDPKVVTWREDGTVKIVEHLPANVETRTLFADHGQGYVEWIMQGGEWVRDEERVLHAPLEATRTSGVDAVCMNPLWGDDLALEAEIRGVAGSVGALLVRANPSGTSGYRVALDFERGTVGFYRRLYGNPEVLIQERKVDIAPDRWHKLKVVAQGQFFDVYVDDELFIVRTHRSFEEGCFGVQAAGDVAFRHIHAMQYIGPKHLNGDAWSRKSVPLYLVR